ncbi:MAG: TonB-dependent receptor plug domain-containing protein, partial [Granulosicoccaceae bacterium]
YLNEKLKFNGLKFFVKDSWSVSDKLTVFPALVFHTEDYLDKQLVEPRLSMEYEHRDDLVFSAGTGVYYAMPDYAEINEVFGNPELEYVRSIHAVVGAQKFFSSELDIKTELYVKESDNLVTGDDTLRYANNGEGTAFGLDTIVHKTLNDKISGWFALSLSRAERRHKITGDRFDFDYDQPFNLSLVGNYKLSERWNASAKLWVHSGAPYTPVTGATERPDEPGTYDPIYGEINSKRFPVYHRLDLRFDRTIRSGNGRHISTYLEIANILGTKNVSDYDYNVDYSQRTEIEQLPRLISLGFKADF